jgi:uncharacterized protein YecE (DUF72 family)
MSEEADEGFGALRVGCSGWLYRHWRGDFYPPGLRIKDELGFYAERFDTAELNASFYRMPSEAAVDGWRERLPEGSCWPGRPRAS